MANRNVETLKSLHRGEIAAAETYGQALEKLHDDPCARELTTIRNDHRDFANQLRQQIHDVGVQPDQGSGMWGAWAKFVEGGAKLFGKTAALKVLKEGEEHGIKEYEDALNEALPENYKANIRTDYLPKLRQHITTLDRLMEAGK